MAFCPKCKTEMGMMDVVCRTCGFDFPAAEASTARTGWEWSSFADLSLLIGGYLSLVGALILFAYGVIAILGGRFLQGFLGILYGFISFGMFVALLRVKSLSDDQRRR